MSEELEALMRQLDLVFFRYAHITGALELYMSVLENSSLQRCISEALSGTESEWKQIHRFMVVDGQTVTWYPELPVQTIIAEKYNLLGFLYGVTLSRMIGELDFYLGAILKNHFGHVETSGSSWGSFIRETGIDLLKRRHGQFVYTFLQERHKIEHNQARIDRRFLQRMAERGVQHAYKEGDAIQKSHIDVLLAQQIVREFAKNVDSEVSNLLQLDQ